MYNPFTIEKQLKQALHIIRCEKDCGIWWRDEFLTFRLKNAGWKPDVKHDGIHPRIVWRLDSVWLPLEKACEIAGLL